MIPTKRHLKNPLALIQTLVTCTRHSSKSSRWHERKSIASSAYYPRLTHGLENTVKEVPPTALTAVAFSSETPTSSPAMSNDSNVPASRWSLNASHSWHRVAKLKDAANRNAVANNKLVQSLKATIQSASTNARISSFKVAEWNHGIIGISRK